MKRHPGYGLQDAARGRCPYCLASAEMDCDCEKKKAGAKGTRDLSVTVGVVTPDDESQSRKRGRNALVLAGQPKKVGHSATSPSPASPGTEMTLRIKGKKVKANVPEGWLQELARADAKRIIKKNKKLMEALR